MKVTRGKLAEIIAQKTMHITDPKQLSREIAAFLMTERMTGQISSITRDIMELRQADGLIEATAVSAHELNQTVIDDIHQLIKSHYPKARKIIINQRHDPSVIGGVKVMLANEQLDLSVQAKLNTFKRLTAQERTM